MSKETIFIQMASFRDQELVPTIRDCIDKAADPERLRFGVCWQRDEMESLAEFASDPRFRIMDVPWQESKGVCWARNRIQQLYRGETYTLQLDSHHRFVAGWDDMLIEMLHSADSPNPLLTGYLPAYTPGFEDEMQMLPKMMLPLRFHTRGPLICHPKTIPGHEGLSSPIPACFYSAHFTFAPGKFCLEVPHDPLHYFLGEEITLAVRAFTHGYDLFHPHRTVAWHHYGRYSEHKHWDDVEDRRAVSRLITRGYRRTSVLLGMLPFMIPFGMFGLGRVRTLHQYEQFSGISFKNRSIDPYWLENERLPARGIVQDKSTWPEELVPQFYLRLPIPAKLNLQSDTIAYKISMTAEDGELIFRTDMAAALINSYGESGERKIPFNFFCRKEPRAFEIVPVRSDGSKEAGIHSRITSEMRQREPFMTPLRPSLNKFMQQQQKQPAGIVA